MRLTSTVPILALTAAGLLSGAATTQARIVGQAPAAGNPRAESTEAQAGKLLTIAAELRRAGRADVADAVTAQARRLLAVERRAPSRTGSTGSTGVASPKRSAGTGATAIELRDVTTELQGLGQGSVGDRTKGSGTRSVRVALTPPPAALPPAALSPVALPPAGLPPTRTGGIASAPENHYGKETHRRIPQYPMGGSIATVNTGRERVRYVPARTERDAGGRLRWSGLPARSDVPTPAEARAAASIEQRVEELQEDVARLTEMLRRLNAELERKQQSKRRTR